MKKFILIFISLILSHNSFSQSPQGFNYQAVVRDIDGNVRSNQGVQFIFEIRNATGNAVYTEFHTAITNKYGLVDDIIIGNGSSSDNFSSIDWSSGIYFVNVKIDGLDMGTTQLLSVPYALYALNAGSGVATDGVGISSTVDNNNGTFTLNYTDGTSFTTINMTGPEGKSAYDSWLSSGEVGTEKEFLVSLIGSSGVKGDKGDTGDKGDKGDPGLDGLGLGDVTGGASSVITENLDTSRVLVSNLVGKISASGISTNELNTLDNITSNVQIQIDQKQNLNQNLSDISTIDPRNGVFIVGDGTKFIKKSPSEVRTSLNLGNIVFQDSTDISITGGSVTGITDITIADGGTGASTPEEARFNLNVDIKGTDNSTDVTLTQVPSNYLSISRQEITSGVVPIELGGTASTSAQGARANLRLGSIATQDSTDISIVGGKITGITDLDIADGGTGASTAADARTNLGLGTVSTQDSSAISITGGSITGITDITIGDGGTGASTANQARTNLGLAIGTDVQAWDQLLEDLSGLSPTTNNFLVGDGTNFTMKSPADSRAALNLGSIATQNINNVKITGGEITGITDISIADGGTGASSAADARTNLGVAIGSDVQAYDAELASVAGLTSAADKGIQFTGSGTASTFDLTAVGKALLDDADAAAQRTTLGVDIGTDVQAYDAELAAIAGLTSAADKGIQFTGSGTAATYDLTSAGKALLDDADAAAQLVTLGVTSTAAELNILDASASNSISSDGAVSNGNFTSNNYKISHTFTIDGNLADDAVTNDITITNNKVLATSVIITSASINVNIDVHTVVTGSFKVRITNKSGAQLNDNSTIIINYIVH